MDNPILAAIAFGADRATSPSCLIPNKVVAPLAVWRQCPSGWSPPLRVLAARDRLHVKGVLADFIEAKVVDGEAIRDWPDEEFVDNTVHHEHCVMKANCSIPFGSNRPSPLPTLREVIWDMDAQPEAADELKVKGIAESGSGKLNLHRKPHSFRCH